ncbi:hypothetical protein PMZ80_004609 [Knufia obscura]|uniref:Uncharacterized protein n=1 Tax=Knufia obscura TaxID=1635080 RepID=A0ABR0RSL7_9EURO|nr:hypothetical protein PMZ80_004609 [Knufia obscura]
MSGGSSGAAGVKNLRAMFENKHSDQSTSPPSRGRSPNGSISSAHSRPVSKVRASFVAVERPGEAGQPAQFGLRKQSDVSSMAEVREEAIMDDGGNVMNKSVTNEAPASSANEPDLGAILKGSPFEGSPVQEPEQSDSATKTETPKPQVSEKNSPEKPKMNGNTSKVVGKTPPKEQSNPKAGSATPKTTKPNKLLPAALNTKAAAPKSKDSPTMPKKSPVLQKKPQQSPTTANGHGPTIKPRGGVSKIQGVMQSANKAKDERAKTDQSKSDTAKEEKKTTAKDVKPPSVASKPTAASKAHAQKQDSASAEPKQPKSPTTTRPVKLPAAATKPTAASAARHDANYESEEAAKATAEKVSRMVGAPRVANTTTRSSLAKKSSRASLANGDDRPKTRSSTVHKPADEGFLARLTRPTAASAQKRHEKAQVNSPPRQRQTPASNTVSKKPGRKSLNIPPKDSSAAKPATEPEQHPSEETTLEPVHEDTQAAVAPESTEQNDDGEPGPAEESAPLPDQQAEVQDTMTA